MAHTSYANRQSFRQAQNDCADSRHSPSGSDTPRFLELPDAPRTASPVPWLTSIHGTRRRGPYGSPSFPGNCGGYFIRDLLRYFRPASVLDPMCGSATCRDVCHELGIACRSFDLRKGADATDPANYAGSGPFDFVWLHPPYWRMIRYSRDPRCLSNAPTVEEFLDRLQQVIRNCHGVLAPGGKLALLIGGYTDRGRYMPLPHLALQRAVEEGLWPACTEIIRLQHGSTGSRKSYRSSFIPGLHDNCLVFRSDAPSV